MEREVDIIRNYIGYDDADFNLRVRLVDINRDDIKLFKDIEISDSEFEKSANSILTHMMSIPELKKIIPEDKKNTLIERYKNYLKSLFSPEISFEEGIRALRAGIVHSEYGVLPKYYINFYSKFLEEGINLLKKRYTVTEKECLILIKRILFHMSLAIDSYFFKKDEEIIKLYRLYNVLSRTNMLVLKVNSIDELFSETVRILVESGGFNAACIGKYDKKTKAIKPIYIYGVRNLIRRVPKFKSEFVIKDVTIKHIDELPENHTWKNILKSIGISSISVVPIFNGLEAKEENIEYILTIYSTEFERFSEKDIRLLKELSTNLSFAVEKISTDEYRKKIDRVTLLPGRDLFIEELEKTVSDEAEKKFAVIILDIDDFKLINEEYGYSVGDILLRFIATKLKSELRSVDYISRIGSDEFGIIVRNISDEKDIVRILEKFENIFNSPFKAGSKDIYLSFSAGISVFPNDGRTAEKLIIASEIALDKAKTRKSTFYFYKAELSRKTFHILKLERKLKRAFLNKEFTLYYQPKIDIKSKKITGVEALLRWVSDGKIIPPVEFIDVLENSGLIINIGNWILKEVCKQAKRWEKKGININIAINISAVQLESHDFVKNVKKILRSTKCKTSMFEFEITETTFIKSMEQSTFNLKMLDKAGVKISIDDFGTGYSSLLYLKKFPIYALKIDREFIKDLPDDKEDEKIVKTIIDLAKNFGIKTIAEGVETKEQLNILTFFGCDEVQGYLYSPPLPAEEFEKFYRDILKGYSDTKNIF